MANSIIERLKQSWIEYRIAHRDLHYDIGLDLLVDYL